MKQRTSVHLGKDVPSPLYFRLVGVASGHRLRIARERDWLVYHFPGWVPPVALVWNTPGNERLFVTRIEGPLPSHEEALAKIDEWMQADWTTHRHEYGGLEIPLAVHEKFVLVPEPADAIDEEEGPLLSIEPPCLLWHERNHKNAAVIAAVVIIR